MSNIYQTLTPWNTDRAFLDGIVRKALDVCKNGFQNYFPDRRFYTRELEPIDIGKDNWVTSPKEGWSWTPWVEYPLEAYKFVTIYGLAIPSARLSITTMKISKGTGGAVTIGRQELGALRDVEPALRAIRQCKNQDWLKATFDDVSELRMEGYFQTIYAFTPNTVISLAVRFDQQRRRNSEIKLLGWIAEPDGAQIATQQ